MVVYTSLHITLYTEEYYLTVIKMSFILYKYTIQLRGHAVLCI